MKNSPRPSRALSAEARRWWRELQTEYSITDRGGLLILSSAAEAFDRMRQAQSLVDREGMTETDRFGQVKSHPDIVIERDCRAAMLAALKQLNLDLEPLHDRAGRPAGSK